MITIKSAQATKSHLPHLLQSLVATDATYDRCNLAKCTLGLLELILTNSSEQTGQDSLEAWKHTLHSAALWSSCPVHLFTALYWA